MILWKDVYGFAEHREIATCGLLKNTIEKNFWKCCFISENSKSGWKNWCEI